VQLAALRGASHDITIQSVCEQAEGGRLQLEIGSQDRSRRWCQKDRLVCHGGTFTGGTRSERIMSVTGIPIEWLFGVLGILVSVIYADIKRELRSLNRSAARRELTLERFRIAISLVCRKLNVPFSDILKGDGDSDTSEHRKF
jgi:hypothetical protein